MDDEQDELVELLSEAQAEAQRLALAIRRALASAEAENIDRHRGTDDPREFVTILREALR